MVFSHAPPVPAFRAHLALHQSRVGGYWVSIFVRIFRSSLRRNYGWTR